MVNKNAQGIWAFFAVIANTLDTALDTFQEMSDLPQEL